MNNQTVEPKKGMNTNFVIVLLLIILIVGLIGYKLINNKETEVMVVETPITPKTKNEKGDSAKVESGNDNSNLAPYKNGTYTVVGEYQSPAGAEAIDVTITLEDKIIKDVTVVAKATNPVSTQRQNAFIEEYKGFVVGKNIDEVKLSKVAGSSLTSQGFNDALKKIKMSARS